MKVKIACSISNKLYFILDKAKHLILDILSFFLWNSAASFCHKSNTTFQMALSYKFIAHEACFFSQISCPQSVSSARSWLREDSAFVCALFRYMLVRKWTKVRTQTWERLFNRCTDVWRERGLFDTDTDFLKPPSSPAQSKRVKCKYVIAILKRLVIFNVTPIGRVHVQEFDDVLMESRSQLYGNVLLWSL